MNDFKNIKNYPLNFFNEMQRHDLKVNNYFCNSIKYLVILNQSHKMIMLPTDNVR